MANPFEPKGNIALWKMVYEAIKDNEVGTVLTYRDLDEIMDEDSKKYRGAIYRASKQLLREKKRMLDTERGVGYRIVEGNDVLVHAEGRHDRANRQVNLARFEGNHVNTIVLSPDEKKRLSDFLVHNNRIHQALTQKVERIEKGQQVSEVALAFTRNEIAQLKELLENKK